MEIIKNNIVSIILGVIALVALTTPLWLLPGYSEDLEAKARASQATATNVTGLLSKERMKPGVDLDGLATPLDRFPNQATIDEGRALQQKVATTATEMVNAAVAINRQSMTLPGLNDVLLVDDSLPRPRNNGAFEFRNRYTALARDNALTRQLLQGGAPPTKEEIDAAINTIGEQIQRKLRTYPGGGDNSEELKAEFEEQRLLVGPRMLNDRANTIRMYVDPNAFTWHPAFAQIGGQAPNPVEIWQAQLGLWIQTSFARAIAAANGDARNVRDATVKRLLRIEFPENPYVLQATPAGESGGMGSSGVPSIPTTEGDPAAPLPRDDARSLTGRVSNPLFDVVHFRAVLHVDHGQLPRFLNEIGEDRLMYIRSMQVEALDPAALQLQGFIYGVAPVVQVTLELETLFMRAWTSELMPDLVRVGLGIPPRDASAFGAGLGTDPSMMQ